MEEMSGILIGVRVYLQEPIQPQTHTVTLIKYHLTVCECVCARGEINPQTHTHNFKLFLMSLSSFIQATHTPEHTETVRHSYKNIFAHTCTCKHLKVCHFMSITPSPHSPSVLQSFFRARHKTSEYNLFLLRSRLLRFTKTS